MSDFKKEQPSLLTLKSRYMASLKDSQSPLHPSMSLPKQVDQPEPYYPFQNRDSKAYQAQVTYVKELQKQMEDNKARAQKEKQRKQQEERDDIKMQMEYNPFGKPGNGAPFRDQNGNIIASRRKPFAYMQGEEEQTYKSPPRDATPELQTNFPNNKMQNNAYERQSPDGGYFNAYEKRGNTKMLTKVELREELDKQMMEKQRKKKEERERQLKEEQLEDIKFRNDMDQLKRINQNQNENRPEQVSEEAHPFSKNQRKANNVTAEEERIQTPPSFKFYQKYTEQDSQNEGKSTSPLLLDLMNKKPMLKEQLNKVREDTMEKLANKNKLDEILTQIEKTIKQKASENSSFYQDVMAKIMAINTNRPYSKQIFKEDNPVQAMDKTLKGDSRLITIKQRAAIVQKEEKDDMVNHFDKLTAQLNTGEYKETKQEAIKQELDTAIEYQSHNSDSKEVINKFDTLLSHISHM